MDEVTPCDPNNFESQIAQSVFVLFLAEYIVAFAIFDLAVELSDHPTMWPHEVDASDEATVVSKADLLLWIGKSLLGEDDPTERFPRTL